MQKHCSHCTTIWEILHAGKWQRKTASFKFMFKCQQCCRWHHFLTENRSRFLPPQQKTLGRRLFEDVSVVRQDPLMTQNANVVDLVDRRHAVWLSVRYVGARPFRHRNASTATLNDIRSGARSQSKKWGSVFATFYFRLQISIVFCSFFLQSVDELLEFIENLGFEISFATCQPWKQIRIYSLHVEGCFFEALAIWAPGTLTNHPFFVIGSLY